MIPTTHHSTYPLPDELTLLMLSYSELPPNVTALVCKRWDVCTDSSLRLKTFFIKFEKYQIQYFNEPYEPALIKIINKLPTKYTQYDKHVLRTAFNTINNKLLRPLNTKTDSNSIAVQETLTHIGYFDPDRPRIAFEWNKWRKFIEKYENHYLCGNKLGNGFEENIILPLLSRTKKAVDVLAPLQLSQCIYLLYIFSINEIEHRSLYKTVENRVIQDSSSNANSEMTYELYYTYSVAIEGTDYNKDLHKYLFENFSHTHSTVNADQLGYMAGAAGNFGIQTLREKILMLTFQLADNMSFADLTFCIKSLLQLNEQSESVTEVLEIAEAKILPYIADIEAQFHNTQERIEISNFEHGKIISEFFSLCRKANNLPENTINLLIVFCRSCKIECFPRDTYLKLLSSSLFFQDDIGDLHIDRITPYIVNNLFEISNDDLYPFVKTGALSILENVLFRASLTKHILYANFKYEPKLLIEIQRAYSNLSPKSIDEQNAIHKIWDAFLEQIENVTTNELIEMHEIIDFFPRIWELQNNNRFEKLAAFNATEFEDLAQVHRLVKIYIQMPQEYFPLPLFANIANFIADSDSNNPLYLELITWSSQYFNNLLDINLDPSMYTESETLRYRSNSPSAMHPVIPAVSVSSRLIQR